MNFKELSQIIQYLKRKLPCNSCQASYNANDIEVLSTFDDQGLFNLTCAKCKTQVLVHITITEEERNLSEPKSKGTQSIRAHRSLKELTAHSKDGLKNISTDDVINMHFFLNSFNGDFKRLFSNKK